MSRPYFNETQRFRQWWVYLVVVVTMGAWVYAVSESLKAAPADKAASDLGLILSGIIPLLIIILLFSLRLETSIRKDGITFRFRPLREKHIKPGEIERWEVRKYRPLAEYGGWGYRTGSRKYGKALNVSGNMGIQLYLTNGKKILIGTQKPEEAAKAMEGMMEGGKSEI